MVMTRSSGSDTRKLRKCSSSGKGGTFTQEGSAMDPIDVEPLCFAPLRTIVPYVTLEDEDAAVPATEYG